MTRPIIKTLGVAASIAAAMGISAPAFAQTAIPTDAGLAAETLSDGRSMQAISMLKSELAEHPGDPALLINLGIAQAQAGYETEARESFETAMRSRESVELDTAEGTVMNSRRLARRAIAMLDRGEFRPIPTTASQFTLRE